jgi:hypothetical protein
MTTTAQEQRVIAEAATTLGLLGVDAPADADAAVLSAAVGRAIRNFCNRDDIPAALESVWASMVVDYARWASAVKKQNDPSGGGASTAGARISSITELSVSAQFSDDTTSQAAQAASAHSVASGVEGIIMDYRDQLYRFRRMTW